MNLKTSSAILAGVLVAMAPFLSDAYLAGSRQRSNMQFASGFAEPGISFPFIQRPDVNQKSATFKSAAMTANSAQQQKTGLQRMLDFYCAMVWIARPDLFLYDRLARMAWDNVSKSLKNLEQEKLPENVLDNALKEMQNNLSEIRNAYVDVTDTQRRMYAQKLQAEDAADELYSRAKYALSRGYEQKARDALFRRQELLDGVKKLINDIHAQAEARETLFTAFQNLEEAFREKVEKRDDLMKRSKTAKQMVQINAILNQVNNNKLSEEAFDHFEENIGRLETVAGASLGLTPISEHDRLETEFAKLERLEAKEKDGNMLKRESSASRLVKAMEKDLEELEKESSASRFFSSSATSHRHEDWLERELKLLGSRRH